MSEVRKLCRCEQDLRWYPPAVDSLSLILRRGITEEESYPATSALRRNIAYNLQYLIYLDRTLRELSLSAVLEKQTFKTFAVTAAGVVEAILDYLSRVNGFAFSKKPTLDRLIRNAESSELLGPNPEIYSELHGLREIRNKVHLAIHDTSDSDWHSFNTATYAQAGRALRGVIFAPMFALTEEEAIPFQFLPLPAL